MDDFQPEGLLDRVFYAISKQGKSAAEGLQIADIAFKFTGWILLIGTIRYLGLVTHSRALDALVYILEGVIILPPYFMLTYASYPFRLRTTILSGIAAVCVFVLLNHYVGSEVDKLATAIANAQANAQRK